MQHFHECEYGLREILVKYCCCPVWILDIGAGADDDSEEDDDDLGDDPAQAAGAPPPMEAAPAKPDIMARLGRAETRTSLHFGKRD